MKLSKRDKNIWSKYNDGMTLEKIGKKYGVTRSRIQQIIFRTIKLVIIEELDFIPRNEEDKKQLNIAVKQRTQEIVSRRNKYEYEGIKKKLKREIYPVLNKSKFYSLSLLSKASGIGEIKIRKYFPEIVEEISTNKKKKWSINYNACRKCGTVNIKHRSNGFCNVCYFKSDEFKAFNETSRLRNSHKWKKKQREYAREYARRPHVRKKQREYAKMNYDRKYFGGNRSKALDRDNKTCQYCSNDIEILVMHVKDPNNHSLKNLITVCKKCFYKKLSLKRTQYKRKK